MPSMMDFQRAGSCETERRSGFVDAVPGVLFNFVLELVFGPSGVAHKGPDDGAGLLDVVDRFLGGNAGLEAELIFVIPECGEGKVGFSYGSTDMDP